MGNCTSIVIPRHTREALKRFKALLQLHENTFDHLCSCHHSPSLLQQYNKLEEKECYYVVPPHTRQTHFAPNPEGYRRTKLKIVLTSHQFEQLMKRAEQVRSKEAAASRISEISRIRARGRKWQPTLPAIPEGQNLE